MKYLYMIGKNTKRVLSLLLVSTLFLGIALAGSENVSVQQGFTIKGKVTADTEKDGLPGVSVVIKGTSKGTVTGLNGDYTLDVPSGDVTLIFSFIGFQTQEIVVGERRTIDLVLIEDVTALEEVVVTALGISRQEKSLGYSVGKVSGSDMVRVVQENALNSLSGKVSGVQINSTGGTGSSVSMVIRGAKSLSNDNQPLFVVDGVPISNTLNNVTEFGSDNRVDFGNAMSDLNSEDIESVSVLKGPSAAALYGSRAGNGVVVITTKSGKKNKGLQVDVSSNTVFDVPYRYYNIQKKFANGYFSYVPSDFPDGYVMNIDPKLAAGCGIELDKGYYAIQWNSPLDANGSQIPTELVSHPNNVANFVQTGITTTNSASVSNNTERYNYRIGVTNMINRGIVPNSDLYRNNVSAATSLKMADNITLSSNINYSQNWSNNRPSGNRGTNPLQWAYAVPQNTDIRDLEQYWEPGNEGLVQRVPDVEQYNNPYYLAHEVNNSFDRDRIFGNLMLEWQIFSDISLMGRFSMDKFSERREGKISSGYTKEINGFYGLQNTSNYERNIDFLAKYSKRLNDFSFVVSAGGNMMYAKATSFSNSSKKGGSGLVIPNLFTIDNIVSGNLVYNSNWSEKVIRSVYAFANLGWRDMVYLDLTARNDWTSTLPPNDRSYFYPSASLSLLIDQMINMGDRVSLVKLRGGWAQVGNDTSPYQLIATYGNSGQWGDAVRLNKKGELLSPTLKPEIATSIEFGTDLGFFDHRLRFEGTYYEIENKNQIIPNVKQAGSSGYTSANINAGLIKSKGWEFTVGGVPVRNQSWMWDVSINITRNRTILKEIAPNVDKIQFWEDAKCGAWSYVGDEIGDIYDAEMLIVTDTNSPYYGYPIISSDAYEWQETKMESTKNRIGNYNPKFILGFQSTLSYKNFSLNWTIDWRNGGQFVSQTERYMAEDGSSQTHLDRLIHPGGRTGEELKNWLVANEDDLIKNGFHVVGGPTVEYGGFRESYGGTPVNDGCFVPGVIAITDDQGNVTYKENLGEEGTTLIQPYIGSYPWEFGKPSTFDADYVKLREISLTYQLPSKFLNKIKGIKGMAVSVYSRNIMLWTKAGIGVDPERAFQPEASTEGRRGIQMKQGIERYNVEPWVFPIGFKLNVTF